MFDSVHLLKCIRNNWLAQKDVNKTFKFPKFSFDDIDFNRTRICNAPFNTLKKLHSVESDSLLKHAYKLTLKSLSPSTLEKPNVNLVINIFNEYVIQALLTLGSKHRLPFFENLAEFIQIIYKWWSVMNVKTPMKGMHHKNMYATPLRNDCNDEKYAFLNNFFV